MGKTKLGINLITMYEKMINEDFDPLVIRLQARTKGIEQKVETQVKKDLGVYKLFAERAALKERLKEIEKTLEKVERRAWASGGRGISIIDREVENRLKVLNAPLEQVKARRDELVRQVKLSGIGADIKAVFDAVPGVLADLSRAYKNLPAITEREIKKISGTVELEPEETEEDDE